MSRTWTPLIWLSMLLFLAGTAFGEEGFKPAWEIGQSWTIESSCKKMLEGKDSWTAPEHWRFEVRTMKEIEGVSCYVLQVTPQDRPEAKTQAILCLAVSDLHPVQIIDIAPDATGRAKATTRTPGGDRLTPLMSGESAIPYDLPLFPLAAENRSGEATGAAVSGEEARPTDGLTFVESVIQSWKPAPTGFQVTLQTSGPLGTIVQTWETGKPWATSMTSDGARFRLVGAQ